MWKLSDESRDKWFSKMHGLANLDISLNVSMH